MHGGTVYVVPGMTESLAGSGSDGTVRNALRAEEADLRGQPGDCSRRRDEPGGKKSRKPTDDCILSLPSLEQPSIRHQRVACQPNHPCVSHFLIREPVRIASGRARIEVAFRSPSRAMLHGVEIHKTNKSAHTSSGSSREFEPLSKERQFSGARVDDVLQVSYDVRLFCPLQSAICWTRACRQLSGMDITPHSGDHNDARGERKSFQDRIFLPVSLNLMRR